MLLEVIREVFAFKILLNIRMNIMKAFTGPYVTMSTVRDKYILTYFEVCLISNNIGVFTIIEVIIKLSNIFLGYK